MCKITHFSQIMVQNIFENFQIFSMIHTYPSILQKNILIPEFKTQFPPVYNTFVSHFVINTGFILFSSLKDRDVLFVMHMLKSNICVFRGDNILLQCRFIRPLGTSANSDVHTYAMCLMSSFTANIVII